MLPDLSYLETANMNFIKKIKTITPKPMIPMPTKIMNTFGIAAISEMPPYTHAMISATDKTTINRYTIKNRMIDIKTAETPFLKEADTCVIDSGTLVGV